MKSLIILASGAGSNAQRIIQHFHNDENIAVSAVISDRAESGALVLARKEGVRGVYISRAEIKTGGLLDLLHSFSPDLIVLAGFLYMIPSYVVSAFPDKIVNLHPSLLPKYGGKGMYGSRVHKSVLDAGDEISGISIHYVNEEYDKGMMIAQFFCPVSRTDTLETLQKKIQQLEHRYFPSVIEKILSS